MVITKEKKMTMLKGLRRSAVWICLLCIGFSTAQAEVQLPHGEFYKNLDDLQVKVPGGEIKIGRTWYEGDWSFNREWAPLRLEIPADGSIGGTITRNDTEFVNPIASRKPVTLSGGVAGYHVEITYTSNDRKTERVIRSGDIVGSATDSAAERLLPLVRWKNTAGHWIDYQLDSSTASSARITAHGDRNGIIANFSYDADERLSGIKDRNGVQVIWYDYDPQGQLQYVRDVESHRVEYHYLDGRLSEVTDLRGYSWLYGYTGTLISSLTDPEGRITEVGYDNAKRVAQVTLKDSGGNRLETRYRIDYDKTKKEYYAQVKDPLGSVTESWYNNSTQLIRKSLNGVETYAMTKDSGGSREIRTKTDRRGLKTVSEYDEWENRIKTTYPDGSTTRASFKPGTNLPSERIDELGRVTQYEYDDNGNLSRLTEAKGTPQQRITEYRYNADGLRIEKKVLADAVSEEAVTSYGYDAQGNLNRITDPELTTPTEPEKGVTSFTHNIRGEVLTRTDPNAKTWINTYDPAGNLLTQTDPLNRTVTLTYDKVGNLKSREDARKHTTTYAYNLLDKRISQTDPLTKKTELGYDGAGRLTTIKDPLGNVQTLGYDLEGRLISQKDPAGNETTLGYGEGAGQGGGVDGT
ncbi:MAG: hypothetical protein ACK2UU_20635, partial [Anaerolineae bacterium]